jgi:hypothetical protein
MEGYPMTDPVSDSALAAAQLLSVDVGPQLLADVEAALQARNHAQRPDQYIDPVSLGSLIVSVATLAWKVYTDLKTKTAEPAPDVVERTVRVRLRDERAGEAPPQLDRIVEVVVSETARVGREHT